MNAEVSIEFNSAGFREILFSDGVKSLVTSAAEKIQSEANAGVTNSKGFRVNVRGIGFGGGRWGGFVSAADNVAHTAEEENQVLSRAVHG